MSIPSPFPLLVNTSGFGNPGDCDFYEWTRGWWAGPIVYNSFLLLSYEDPPDFLLRLHVTFPFWMLTLTPIVTLIDTVRIFIL